MTSSQSKKVSSHIQNAIEKVGAVNINNIEYIAELKMFGRSSQYKTKCAYWQCRLSELTNTLLTLTKRAGHIFYLVSSLPKNGYLPSTSVPICKDFLSHLAESKKFETSDLI